MNELSDKSEIFIFSDGARNIEDKEKVKEVRKIINNFVGFKNITIFQSENNKGLAESVISGVTKIVNEYGKVIVLEDDIVTSKYFLKFMNDALNFYKEKKKVWHISGWNYPIDPKRLGDAFLWRGMECWGWGTWDDRWNNFEKDTDKLIKEMTKEKIKKLNLDGTRNIWQQVIANKNEKLNTWAVYWYSKMIQNDALSINPTVSYVKNIGLDGSGENCGNNDFQKSKLSRKRDFDFPSFPLKENIIAVDRIKKFHREKRGNLFVRGLKKIYRSIIK